MPSELEITNFYLNRIKNSKTEKQYKRNCIDLKLYASSALAKRYSNMKECISDELVNDAIEVIKEKYTEYGQKKAARLILNFKFGEKETNKIIEKFAIVEDRDDPLVRQWRKKVIARDKQCVYCGSNKNLQVHHISKWSEDPVNRINIDNGITLCTQCHAKEHPEIKNLITSHEKEELRNG